mmetsp:Transcript_19591/g.40614  ORF Transcript_19591/g.40614 Transcript_19591/m.40614 type:complete len:269 (+) Transcript_19591:265-1071(+)
MDDVKHFLKVAALKVARYCTTLSPLSSALKLLMAVSISLVDFGTAKLAGLAKAFFPPLLSFFIASSTRFWISDLLGSLGDAGLATAGAGADAACFSLACRRFKAAAHRSFSLQFFPPPPPILLLFSNRAIASFSASAPASSPLPEMAQALRKMPLTFSGSRARTWSAACTASTNLDSLSRARHLLLTAATLVLSREMAASYLAMASECFPEVKSLLPSFLSLSLAFLLAASSSSSSSESSSSMTIFLEVGGAFFSSSSSSSSSLSSSI